ncbi:MAG: hypothetical protein ACM30G_04100 [Micromonosporaceae bacterium]
MFQQPAVANAAQHPPAGTSSATWEQDVGVGGEDVHSEPAAKAVAVSVQGIATVRNVPSLAAATNLYQVAINSLTPLLGRSPQRRAVTIVSSVAGYICAGKPAGETGPAGKPQGMPVPANTPVYLSTSAELYFFASAAGEVGYLAEIDLG